MTDSHRVHSLGYPIVDIRNEKCISLLLLVKIFYIYAMVCQIGVKLWLLREISLVYLLVPKWMLPQMLPVDSFNRVLLKQSSKQIIEHG